jgi:hypothetical protein
MAMPPIDPVVDSKTWKGKGGSIVDFVAVQIQRDHPWRRGRWKRSEESHE